MSCDYPVSDVLIQHHLNATIDVDDNVQGGVNVQVQVNVNVNDDCIEG